MMNPLIFYVVASYLTAGALWNHLGGSWKRRFGLFIIAPLICPALLWVEFVALVVERGFKELPPKDPIIKVVEIAEQRTPLEVIVEAPTFNPPKVSALCPIPEAIAEPPIPSDPADPVSSIPIQPVAFACKLCKANHPSIESDVLTRVPKIPSSITTRKNEKGEWMFVCAEQCDKKPIPTIHQETADILTRAADLLEHNTRWGQGGYYQFDDQGCTMDAHGAIAYCGDPKIKADVLAGITPNPHAVAPVSIVRTAGRFYDDFARDKGLTVLEYMAKYYGGAVGAAHYQSAKVGLDFEFNDANGRTREEIIAKLREAAKAAITPKETTQ